MEILQKDTQKTNLILKGIEKIANAFKNTQLNEENKSIITQSVTRELNQVQNFLHCSENEAWLFAIMFAMSISGKEADLDSLTQYLDCNPFFIVSLAPVLDNLVKKRLLLKSSGYDMKIIATRFYISNYVFNAISLNKPISNNNQFLDVYEVIERVNEMICERERNNVPTEDLISESINLLQKEKQFPLVKRILEYDILEEDRLLLVYLCYAYANNANEADIERYIYYVYESMGSKIRAKKNLFSGQSALFEQELIAFIDDNFYGGRELRLTDKAIENLFAEDLGALEKNKPFQPKHCTIHAPEKIKTIPLHFNEREKQQISTLRKLFQEDNFQKATQKFAHLGMPKGISILLYGAPGTGKTQIAYNLAQETGRILMMVDIASVKDKYVGESEKRIKQVFKSYRQACEHHEINPILLFNESDALISKRYAVNSSVDQMNNSMQNILLQELEDFEGILISTSNLNINLDNAFERRFLYKIRFDKPSFQVRKKIWREKIPELSEKQIVQLSENYHLSGGQINNVSKKYLLENILNEEELNWQVLNELCELEFLDNQTQKVGF